MFTQNAILSDGRPFADFITLSLRDGANLKADFLSALRQLPKLIATVNKAEPTCQIEWLVAFSDQAWSQLFEQQKPSALVPFTEMKQAERHFPATAGDIFVYVKSERMDLNFRIAKGVADLFEPIAEIIEDTQGYQYLIDRDMIDFVDGTENPVDEKRVNAVLIGDEDPNYQGGSYITLQRYVHNLNKWNDLAVSQQEQVIGRSKADNVEFSGEKKAPFAHINKGKSTDEAGKEIPMYRQNMPYGNAIEHGSVFIGFAKSPEVINISLRKMIFADEQGHYDHLLKYTRAVTGCIFFVPPADFLNTL
ncbi:Dyp-type peroxidase [Motilimonas eburnea]|uniref:Dyp-type peroxidase n=1 Tax=Motilimonas eburnea TaxID=1737488 RepID=UPI001E539E53|nr:Dyp-type peroxidase [Motilimonas eburnea]MCE2573631.1 Dyp-type peroxidase [Motilimonas eburnea]